MPISPYIADLRRHIGHGLLMLPSVSAVVVNDAGEILLVQRADNGRWSLPAGAIDPGEQPAEAITREVYEETRVHIVVERLAGVVLWPVTYPNGDTCQYLDVWFRARARGGVAHVGDDVIACRDLVPPRRLTRDAVVRLPLHRHGARR